MHVAKGWIFACFGLSLGVATAAWAQPAIPYDDTILVAPPDEQMAFVESVRGEVAEVTRRLSDLAARHDASAHTSQCVVTRLASARALRRVTDKGHQALAAALAAAEPERVHHEIRKATAARAKSQGLLGEAQRCVGMVAVDVSSTAPPVSPAPPTELQFDDGGTTPPPVSPFQ